MKSLNMQIFGVVFAVATGLGCATQSTKPSAAHASGCSAGMTPAMATLASNRTLASVNNDIAASVCEAFSKADYPDTYADCRKIASRGNYNAVAAQLCATVRVLLTPMDQVACLESIRDRRFDNRAANACLELAKQFNDRGVQCLKNTSEKFYSDEEAEACGSDAACWARSGKSLPTMPGF